MGVSALLVCVAAAAGAAHNGAVLIKEAPPPATLAAGQQATVSITLRNSGDTVWDGEKGYKLGAQSPQDNVLWRAGRVKLDGLVKPGGTHTFTFTITAPVRAGTYSFQWRMVQEKKEWFGQLSPIHKVFVRPERSLYGFTMGFEVQGKEAAWTQPPQFEPFDRRDPRWWDEMLEEASVAGADFVAPVTRGCNPCKGGDAGNSCPKDLDKLVAALKKRPPENRLKVALFVDTGGAFSSHKNACKGRRMDLNPPFDLGDATGSGEGGYQYFWDHDIKIFYDAVPKEDLFTIDDRPVIYFWSLAPPLGYANHKGNSSKLLAYVRAKAKARFGVEPFVVVDQLWPKLDPTVTTAVADGVNDWFDPKLDGCTVRDWGGRRFAVSVPGFTDPPGGDPKDRRVLPRKGGGTLSACLDKIRGAGTYLTLLEGLTDAVESAGYYRSKSADWVYPDQYLDLVRAGLRPK